MSKEMTYTPQAIALAKKVDETLERINQRFTSARVPDPAWSILNAAEMDKRIAKKEQDAIAANTRDAREILKELDALIEQLRKEKSAALYPQTSDNDAMRYDEEKAHRVASAVRLPELVNVYDEAMQDNLVAYATHLLDWAERFIDKTKSGEFSALLQLKSKHIDATGVQPLIDSREMLSKKKGAVIIRQRMTDAGYTKNLSQASSFSEVEEMLKVGGLAQ